MTASRLRSSRERNVLLKGGTTFWFRRENGKKRGNVMDTDVPRMPSVKNLHAVLDAIQKAAVPDAFGVDFLKDMGFTSSNDRSVIKVLKYLGMLDASGKPQNAYAEFMDNTKAKKVLADCMYHAYDDLFKSDKNAHSHSATDLTGWFKTKTRQFWSVPFISNKKRVKYLQQVRSDVDYDFKYRK